MLQKGKTCLGYSLVSEGNCCPERLVNELGLRCSYIYHSYGVSLVCKLETIAIYCNSFVKSMKEVCVAKDRHRAPGSYQSQ